MYELSIAIRYISANKKQAILSVCAVAIGIMMLIVVAAMLHGYSEKMVNILFDVSSDVIVYPKENENDIYLYKGLTDHIQQVDHVKATAPFVLKDAILTKDNNSTGVQVKGVDPELEVQVSTIYKKVIFGSFDDLDRNKMLIGKGVAKSLGVKLGDEVTLSSIEGQKTDLEIVGIIETGLQQYDEIIAYVTLDQAQDFFGIGKAISGISIRTDDRYNAEIVAKKIRDTTDYKAKSWIEINKSLLDLLKINDQMTYMIVLFTVLVAAFGITNTMSMLVMKKTSEIGMLKAMGATRKSIMLIYTLEGFIFGVLGAIFGCVSGYLISYYLSIHEIKLEGGEMWGMNTLPIVMYSTDFVYATILAISIGTLAGLYPAYVASKMDPVEAIRTV
ncbi:MAG: ABC transporter permease [Methanosarcinales archaeon]